MWRDHDRFPVSALDPAGSRPAVTTQRPFGLWYVDYSPGRPRFNRRAVTLCPQRQIGLIDGVAASDVMPMAATMTSTKSDGKDVLTVDWMTDDNYRLAITSQSQQVLLDDASIPVHQLQPDDTDGVRAPHR